jgi:uncharacterized protein (DUF885 family)
MTEKAIARVIMVVVAVGALARAGGAAPKAPADEHARLWALFDEHWEWTLRESPGEATEVGDSRYDDRLEDLSPSAIERRKAAEREFQKRAHAIQRARLTPADQLNLDLFIDQIDAAVEAQRFPSELMPMTQIYGVHSQLADLARLIARRDVADLERFVKRIEAFPTLVEQAMALMRTGLERGVTPPRVAIRALPELIGNQIADDPTKTPVYQLAFASLPSSIPAAEQERVREAAKRAIADKAVPALRALQRFVRDEYLPKARETLGLSALPDGAAWYAFAARRSTTTTMTPDEIHELGLAEVKRIEAQMTSLMREVGWKGTLAEFFNHLRTDKRFFHTSKEALLVGYRDIAKRVDPELPKLFGVLPRLPYGVTEIPAHAARSQPTAFYQPGSAEAGRPGQFMANTYDLGARPIWEMEALTLHEAVPGHHLQIALAAELPDVPKFRRWGFGYTAFVEGWGLYAESLGHEIGLYANPYSRFGQLVYEMWRAIRLVVDTGIHMKGWNREQAIRFFRDHSGKTEHDIAVEVDRYIVWPGQALGYKIGQLKLRALRTEAEQAFAARGRTFDVRGFHDAVLGAGALPLTLLEKRVRAWVASTLGGTK